MAITKNVDRQWPLVAIVDIAFGDTPTTATFYEAADLPGKARVIGGALIVKTVWDSSTNLFAVGDSGSADRYLTSQDIKVLGTTVFDFNSDDGVAPLDVGVTYTETGGATTTGAAQLVILYVIDERSNEIQPATD